MSLQKPSFLEHQILSTVAYGDIFDYPLTKEEIWEWAIVQNKTGNRQHETCYKNLKYLVAKEYCGEKSGYFFLKDREHLVETRQNRKKWSTQKIKKAEKVAKFLKLIPWVKLVGITGALARNNATKDDDIDFLIITATNRLWLTRLLVVSFLSLLRAYRRPQKVTNMICPNMFISEDALKMQPEDLFIAHEVCLMVPIFEKNNAYQKFLKANLWVERFLPNRMEVIKKLGNKVITDKKEKTNFLNYLFTQLLNFFERLARNFQLWYMSSKRTREIVSDSIIKFHPEDVRSWVLEEYKMRLALLSRLGGNLD